MAVNIRSEEEIDFILGQGQTTLGEYGLRIVRYRKENRTNNTRYTYTVYKAVLLRIYLKAVLSFDGEIKPYLRLPENEDLFETLLSTILELSENFNLGTSTVIVGRRLPIVLAGNSIKGDPGEDGEDGSDANIILQLAQDEKSLNLVSSTGPNGETIYTLNTNLYVPPKLVLGLFGVYLFEKGTVNDVTFVVQSTKGSLDILEREITEPSGITLVNDNINQPGDQLEVGQATGLTDSQDITARLWDGRTELFATESVEYVYPILYGVTSGDSVGNYYTDLTKKLVRVKERATVPITASNQYIWVCVPAFNYPTLDIESQELGIFDENDINIIDSFDPSFDATISSVGLPNDWIDIDYKIYRTAQPTTYDAYLNLNFTRE